MKEFTRYTLMHKNTSVLEFSFHHATGVIGGIEAVTAPHHAPVGPLAQGHDLGNF